MTCPNCLRPMIQQLGELTLTSYPATKNWMWYCGGCDRTELPSPSESRYITERDVHPAIWWFADNADDNLWKQVWDFFQLSRPFYSPVIVQRGED